MSSLDTWEDLGVAIIQKDTAPVVPHDDDGRLWFNPTNGVLYIWLDGQWSSIGSGNFPGLLTSAFGAYVLVNEAEPQMIDEFDGDLWYNPKVDVLSIRVNGVWKPITFLTGGSVIGTQQPAVPGAGATDTQYINLNIPGGSNLGAAARNWQMASPNNQLTGNPLFATYRGNTYILTDPNKPTNSASWAQLSAAAPTITTQSINLGTAGANIGAGYTAWAGTPGNVLIGDIIIANWGTPASAYILTDKNAPNQAASWTSLGSAPVPPPPFATAADILAGTEAAKTIAPDQLRAHTLVAPTATPANDADHLVRLNAQGKIAPGFLPVSTMSVHSAVAPTVDPSTLTVNAGDIIFMNASGTMHAGWGLGANVQAKAGDAVIYDGAAYHMIPNEVDLSAYVPLAGATMNDGAHLNYDRTTDKTVAAVMAGTQDPITIIDGDGGVIDNVIISGGKY